MPKTGTKTAEDLADEVQDAAEAAGDEGLSDMKTFAEQDAAAARLNGSNGAPSPFAAMVAQGGEPAATDTDAGFEENAPAGPITLTSTPPGPTGQVQLAGRQAGLRRPGRQVRRVPDGTVEARPPELGQEPTPALHPVV
jgi:hypothetical protein